ncbi:MAG: hypothetical protein PVF83_02515 [Anaerolineales bacterium]
MPQNKPNTQTPKGKPSWMDKDTPYYLPFAFTQIKQNKQGVSSVEEAQDDFVAQAGTPKALPDEKMTEKSPSEQ